MNSMSDGKGGDSLCPGTVMADSRGCAGVGTVSECEYRLLFGLDLGRWSAEEAGPPVSTPHIARPSGEAPVWQRRLQWRRWLSRIASDRDAILAGARQAFGPEGESDEWVLRVFESVLDGASVTEAGAWYDLLADHLRRSPGSGGKLPSVDTRMLAWRFLERLERQKKLPSLLPLAVEVLSGRPPFRFWSDLCRYCCLSHPGEAVRFAPFIVERLSPLTEPVAETRKAGWLTLVGILGECSTSREWTSFIRETACASVALETAPDVLPALLDYILLAENGMEADRWLAGRLNASVASGCCPASPGTSFGSETPWGGLPVFSPVDDLAGPGHGHGDGGATTPAERGNDHGEVRMGGPAVCRMGQVTEADTDVFSGGAFVRARGGGCN